MTSLLPTVAVPRRAWLAALLLTAAGAAGAEEACRPIRGLEPLLRPGAVLLLGEIHGTAEAPAFLGDVACHAARTGLPAIVALELAVSGQARVDAFLDSDGGEAARRALLAGPDWQRDYQDGRNSQAMFALIDRLRRLRRSGASARVALFDTGGSSGQARERGMAGRLAELAREADSALVVVLTGNLHSRTGPGRPGNADYQPMGHLLASALPPGRLVGLDQAHGGGTAWICSPGCGVARLGGRRGERPWEVEIGSDPAPGHDGWYRVGKITASPPARLPPAERDAPVDESRRSAEAATAPPPAAAPRTGPLSGAERAVQGRWLGFDSRRGFRTWSLDVEGRGFRAEGSGEWYEGRLVVHDELVPTGIDFVIERCLCAYQGGTSRAVFELDGRSLLVAATSPGNPRPSGFDSGWAQLLRFEPR